MANSDSSDTGVGIHRQSLITSLEDRYNRWKNDKECDAGSGPLPGVDFMDNRYVSGFKKNMKAGASSEIRNIAQGGNGSDFIYGNEKRIPQKVSDSIRTTHGAGPANTIQKEFQANPQVRVTRFTSKGLNYLDGLPGFNNTKYWTGGIDTRRNIRIS